MAGGETLLASRYRVEVDTSATETPTWAPIMGVAAFAPNIEVTDADDSDFEDAGWKSSVRVSRQWTATATINLKKNSTGTALDTVHAKLVTASRGAGNGARISLRYYDRDGLEDAQVVTCLVQVETDGEGVDDLGAASLTFTGCGAPVSEANPNAGV